MAKIYHFTRREKTLREQIEGGRITKKIRSRLQEAHQRHQELYPECADTEFLQTMLRWQAKLTSDQKDRLLDILKYEVQEEDYPHGILDIRFPS